MKTLQLGHFKKQLQGFYLQIPASHLPCKLTPSHHWIVCAFMQCFLSACALKRAARGKLLRPAVVLWWWCKTGVFPHLENILFFPSSAWLLLQIFPSNLCLTHETKKAWTWTLHLITSWSARTLAAFLSTSCGAQAPIYWSSQSHHTWIYVCNYSDHWYSLCNCHSRRPAQCRVKHSSE